jgi:hypothetical protein
MAKLDRQRLLGLLPYLGRDRKRLWATLVLLIPVAGADHFTITHELRDADGILTRQLLLLA